MLKAIGSKKDLTDSVFHEMIRDLLERDEVIELDSIVHHHVTTRLQHSINVAYYNYLLCRLLRLDTLSAARAGLLHDLFYYVPKDYVRHKGEKFHNGRHPLIACENAEAIFPLSGLERDIILKHMWPMTLKLPRHRESFVIVAVDKYCAVLEFTILNASRLKKAVKTHRRSA